MSKRAPLQLDDRTRRWTLWSTGACLLPLLLQLPPQLAAGIAASAIGVTALSWRRPMPGLLRLLISLALIALVLVLSRFAIGRDTGCALLAAMLAIKPSETFTLRDGRSLMGFALFAPFATFLLDQGPLSLTLGLTAVLLVLATLQRMAELESGDVKPVGPRKRLTGVGRLVAVGLPIALAAFWLFPRVASPMWGIPERAMARTGLSDSMSPGDWLDLMADDTPALRVRFFGATPPTSQMYWRGPVFWEFDGRTWTQPRWRPGQAHTLVEPGAVRWDYEMEVEATDSRMLVALDLPLEEPRGTYLNPDHALQTFRPLTAISRWRMQSAPPARYEADLSPAARRYALGLPEGFNPRTVALARQWRAEAGARNDAAIVDRALQWIRRDFAYTLETPLLGRHSVDEFLFDQKAGFCEHFSSSFVVLMRAAGIPSRVVTGYAGGYRNPLGDYWLVRRSDAHAWAEVWLRGRGWVRVDPTAAVAPERIYDTLQTGDFGATGLQGVRSLFDVTDWVRRGWNDFVVSFDAQRQERLLSPLGVDRLDPRTLIAMLVGAMAIGLLWMVWFSRRSERERDPVLRAWHRLARRYGRFGLERAPSETASGWVSRVAAARPDLAAELGMLSQRFSDWRYADAQTGGRSARALVKALRAHRPPATSPGERR
ncbi:transglutaminase TgpA family protein [Lysobacter auxotrophicus]|uniref:Transglutaminase-like domain-containing protein n=1 Tax=Lysobacter auxotrophicus TaxID=2992573 RepID=A0ABN6ULS2_9GAMM|nr:DUF3488 and transglutaminase-like domain-containing protein [Lysobacter auxotrophicus]BDU17251.1 transglutaminase-like domain-containing protein [Lysobacter auxotrophicus]